ncbi:hypothetical protein K438DRAFT_1852521 [Mycena galopus ATCC 62051]|nr:hypothetical protein K438DRAFT_1852521 [Mycena galopus ATCC 62051]
MARRMLDAASAEGQRLTSLGADGEHGWRGGGHDDPQAGVEEQEARQRRGGDDGALEDASMRSGVYWEGERKGRESPNEATRERAQVQTPRDRRPHQLQNANVGYVARRSMAR